MKYPSSRRGRYYSTIRQRNLCSHLDIEIEIMTHVNHVLKIRQICHIRQKSVIRKYLSMTKGLFHSFENCLVMPCNMASLKSNRNVFKFYKIRRAPHEVFLKKGVPFQISSSYKLSKIAFQLQEFKEHLFRFYSIFINYFVN